MFYLLIIVLGIYAFYRIQGPISFICVLSILLFMNGLISGDAYSGILGAIFFVIWLAVSAICMGGKEKAEQEHVERIKKQRKEEEEWGIIDFSDKSNK